MSVERYGENGEIIYAPEGGPLKNLWKYMAVINNDANKEETPTEIPFDYNEFFKRLYLSRAELDVTNSVLQLLLGEGDGNISLEAIHHENVEDIKENISSATLLRIKTDFLKEISGEMRKSSEALGKNRREEHEIISDVLLEMREKFRWNLVRISSADQVQVTLDYQEATPIIGIDYSPMVLFKSPSPREQQYNYNLLIGGDNLALVLRGKSGDLSLLFQSKHLDKNSVFSVKNLKTGEMSSFIIFRKFESKIVVTNSDLDLWNSALKDARNQTISLNLMKLLHQEASKFPHDQVAFDETTGLEIIIEKNFAVSFSLCDDICDTSSFAACDVYNRLLCNYLSSSGRELRWPSVRNELCL